MQGTGGGDINHNIIKRISNTDTGSAIGIYITAGSAKASNNIIYDWGDWAEGAVTIQNAGSFYFYNNTLQNNTSGLCRLSGSFIAKNNIVKGSGNTLTYIGTFAAGTDYNSTDSTDDIGTGSNNKISQTFTFKDEASDDFHLAYADTGARASGTNLSGDGNCSVVCDIDMIPRPSIFDIGADQFDILKPRNRIENY
jgi:hypothetical protein